MYWILLCLLGLSSACSPPPLKKTDFPIKELRMAIAEDPSTLDPKRGGDVLSTHLQLMMFEGLTYLNQDKKISLGQCSKIAISPDKRTYIFSLGQKKWSDGSFVTSYDFVRAWKTILTPDFPSPNAHLLYVIRNAKAAKQGLISLEEAGIWAPDPNTLIVELEQPTPYFLELISFCTFAPMHPIDETISNGPFQLQMWSHQNEILLTKNPYYASAHPIHLDAIHLSVVNSALTALQMYENGDIDLIGEPFSKVPTDLIPHLPVTERLQIPVAATIFISFNIHTLPFSNKKIRQAFSLALNRQEILTHLLTEQAICAFSAVPPCLKQGKDVILCKDNHPQEAKQLLIEGLNELGMTTSDLENTISYMYSSTSPQQEIAQVLQQQWIHSLGLRIPLENVEPKILLEKLQKKTYQFGQTSYRAQYFDPLSILERFQFKENPKNYPCWEHADYQNLLISSFKQSNEERKQTLAQAEKILIEDMPLAPLFHLGLHYIKKPYLRNIQLSPAGGIFFERLDLDAASVHRK